MVMVCRNRPNRSERRGWTPKAAARAACAAHEDGYTSDEIYDEIEECLGPREADCRKEKKRAEAAMAMAMELLEGNQQTLAITAELLKALGLIFRSLLFVLRRSGVGNLASIPITVITQSIQTTSTIVASRRAANDAIFQQVRALRRAA